jgi:hypothetical protein
VPQAPWIIKRIDLDLKAVWAEIEAVKSGRTRSRFRSEQPELPLTRPGKAGEEQALSCFPETVRSETTQGDQ